MSAVFGLGQRLRWQLFAAGISMMLLALVNFSMGDGILKLVVLFALGGIWLAAGWLFMDKWMELKSLHSALPFWPPLTIGALLLPINVVAVCLAVLLHMVMS